MIMIKYTHKKQCEVIIDPCPNHNGSFVKPTLKVGREWIVTPHPHPQPLTPPPPPTPPPTPNQPPPPPPPHHHHHHHHTTHHHHHPHPHSKNTSVAICPCFHFSACDFKVPSVFAFKAMCVFAVPRMFACGLCFWSLYVRCYMLTATLYNQTLAPDKCPRLHKCSYN